MAADNKKKILITVAVIAVAVAFLILGAGLSWYNVNKKANVKRDMVVYVYPSTQADEVLQQISDSSAVKNMGSLKKAFSKMDVEHKIKPGRYELKKGQVSIYVARMLTFGWQSPCKLTFSGTMRQKGVIAHKVSAQMMVDSATVAKALNDSTLLSQYGFTPSNVFSLILPDTYEIYWTATMPEILDKLKAAYDAFWTEDRVEKAKDQGLTPLKASIVASIVCGESNFAPEYPKIAGVYLNRLHKGMKLQADPTVAFCYNYTLNRILLKHLEIDSPYNTYKYAGLPPGPICVASKEALDAVLDPDTAEGYLFFCANSDFSGSHLFASTMAEHARNARAFQQALNQRNK